MLLPRKRDSRICYRHNVSLLLMSLSINNLLSIRKQMLFHSLGNKILNSTKRKEELIRDGLLKP